MEDYEVQTSSQIYARIGAVLYPIFLAVGLLGEAWEERARVTGGLPC